ncbi:putative PMT_2 domain-containing protein [Azospirillaceae bacterium]
MSINRKIIMRKMARADLLRKRNVQGVVAVCMLTAGFSLMAPFLGAGQNVDFVFYRWFGLSRFDLLIFSVGIASTALFASATTFFVATSAIERIAAAPRWIGILPSEPHQDRSYQTTRHAVISICLATSLSALLAIIMHLSVQDFVLDYTRHSLERLVDFEPAARAQLGNYIEFLNPINSFFYASNKTASVIMFKLLVGAGAAPETARGILLLFYSTAFGSGFGWLFYAACRRRSAAVAGVLIAFSLPHIAVIYGLFPIPTLSGVLSVSLFCMAVASCMLGWRLAAIVLWLCQGAFHLTTFVAWSPVILLCFSYSLLERWKLSRRALAIGLVVAPPALGLLAGALEAGGVLPFRGDPVFWALDRVRTFHTVFLFTERYHLVIAYLSELLAIGLLCLSPRAKNSPLHNINVWVVALGAGVFLMYALAVETEWSVIASFFLPLRYECILVVFLLANLFHTIGIGRTRLTIEKAIAAATLFSVLLASRFPHTLPDQPMTTIWIWAMFQAWLERVEGGPKIRPTIVFAAPVSVVLVVLAYLLWAPSASIEIASSPDFARLFGVADANMEAAVNFLWQVERYLGVLIVGALATPLFRCAHRIRLTGMTAALVWITFATPAPSSGAAIFDRKKAQAEFLAVFTGQIEDSPEKQAIDWMHRAIPPGAPTLVYQGILVGRVGFAKTTLDLDNVSIPSYWPPLIVPVAQELSELYGIDLLDMRRKRARIWNVWNIDLWRSTRDRFLSGSNCRFPWVVEPTKIPPSTLAQPVFQNDFMRAYFCVNR